MSVKFNYPTIHDAARTFGQEIVIRGSEEIYSNVEWIREDVPIPTETQLSEAWGVLKIVYAKSVKKVETQTSRDIGLKQFVSYNDWMISKDFQSNIGLFLAIPDNEFITWITVDNRIVEISKQQAIDIAVLIKRDNENLYAVCRKKKDWIENLEVDMTKVDEEVNRILAIDIGDIPIN